MKIKIIILSMAASLLLPLAWAYARLGPDNAMDVLSGNTDYLPGQAVDEGAMQRGRERRNGCGRGNGPGNGGSGGGSNCDSDYDGSSGSSSGSSSDTSSDTPSD